MPAASPEAFRILVLTDAGGVLEGDAAVADGRAITSVLKERDGERIVERAMRLTLDPDGAPRVRLWPGPDTAVAPVLDLVLRR